MTDLRSELTWLVERFIKYLWCVEHEWGGEIEEYNAEEARSQALLKLTDWQPIETAPKDGTEILGWDGVCRTTISWDSRAPAYWRMVVAGEYAEDDKFEPTHWMPLPDPPA